jgi:DNA (cytosine-5)-methyltransferase 1
MSLVLSLFPGIGLLDMAFEEEGFCVVRGPDVLWGGDIRRFHPPRGKFDGVIGGPPCQMFSRLHFLVKANGRETAPDLIPEFERVVLEAQPEWFLMENVPTAPEPTIPYYLTQRFILRDVWVGGDTNRLRAFTWGDHQLGDALSAPDFMRRLQVGMLALHRPDPEPSVLASGGAPDGVQRTARAKATRKGASALGFKTKAYYQKALRDSGLPLSFLADAPFTIAGKIKCVGNGVPLAMGRAVAKAVREALG